MKKSGEKIRVRILIPLVVALIIMLTASLFSSYRLQQYHLDTDMQFRRSNLERLFNDLVEKEAKTLQTYIKVIGENRQLREAWLRGNRDEVRSKALTFFEELNTQAGVTHFYFINSERICFLRMHHPSRFGDIINRVTLDRAVFSREVSNGLELGTMGTFTLRVVMPWIINGQMNGYIELGKEIENIKLDLENLFGVRLIFAIEKKYVDRRGWESGMKMLGRSLDWNEFSDFVVTMENPEDLSPKIEEHIRTFLLGREDDVSFRDGDKRLMVGSIPLQDVRRRTVGEMFVVYDVTESVSNLRHINKLLVGLSFLLGSGVFFLFYFYIGRIEDKLGLSFNELTREIAERRRAESLLEDAREHLESEVARRTEELKTTNSALVQEVEERLRAEEALKLDEERLEALLELSQREWKTKDDLTNYALEEGVRLNKSTMGYLHFFREDWNELELFTWNQPELSSDSKVENVSCPLEKQSIWRECAQQGKPIIFNNYQEEAENLGETGGVNLPLVRLMSVPVFEGRELIAVAGVGNKQEFYDQNDVRQLTLYMSSMLKILQTKKTEESLRNSEEKYRRLFGEALDAIMVTDAETGVLVDCNHTATVLTGRSRKELLTMHQSDLYDVGEKKVRSVVFLPRTWSGKMEEDFLEVSIRTKKGELREVTIKSNIFEYQGKKLVQSIIRDVTSQKHALEKLERSEKKFRQLFDSASDAIFIHNLQGRFLEVNDAACTRLGYTREELYTMTPYNLDHPDESVKVNERIRILLKQGYNLFETFHVTKKQQVIPTEVSSRVIDFEGERAVLSIARDITERKKYEAELLQARVEAEAANEAKSRFLANVSHEIRTPMNAIMGMGYLALQSNPSVVVQDYLNKIHSSAYSLLGIINDILDFSKIEAGRMDLETVSFTLDQVLTHVINLTGTKLKEKRLELVISISENVPQNLLGDPLRLGQILTNLVYNSIKFTDSGEIVISVYASELTSDHCKMNFSVRDTGIGMDQEQVKGIFQAFSQADASITRRFGGTGLGLAISKKLVEMMGGGMSIESELGIGSTFSFTSVLSISSDECTNIYDNVPNVSGMRALVIDDNSTAGDVLCKMFDHYGIKAELALSQEEGIRKLAKNESDWDLVFVDWNLGGESGHKVVSSIVRSVGAVQPPLLVMLTGFGYDGIKEAQKFGVEYFLAKPLLPSVISKFILENVISFEDRPISDDEESVVAKKNKDKVRGARVLVVEDYPLNQEIAQEILEWFGVKVTLAGNGCEALEILSSNGSDFDAVLMDLQMPEMDGYTATSEIRKLSSKVKDIPIIAMTAHAMEEEREKCLRVGMNDHVSKPIDIDNLVATLVRWIGPISEHRAAMAAERDKVGDVRKESLPSENLVKDVRRNIPGINERAGLKRLNNNRELYLKLLSDLVRDSDVMIGKIEAALDAVKSEEAMGIVHGLKGMAGNVSAVDIFTIAKRFERSLKNGRHEEWPDFLNSLRCAGEVTAQSVAFLQREQEGKREIGQWVETDRDTLVASLVDLTALLKRNNMKAKKQFALIKNNPELRQCEADIRAMENAMEGLRFGEALNILQKICRALDIDKEENYYE